MGTHCNCLNVMLIVLLCSHRLTHCSLKGDILERLLEILQQGPQLADLEYVHIKPILTHTLADGRVYMVWMLGYSLF